ncbi:MAG: pyridoxamine 5'-phosphate oxidase family protein [Deltaproteobacteria bacterium]|nr:pyridoxamine 5'-phosphate oxidase family protein [Deltaproteobacteria bacterium]
MRTMRRKDREIAAGEARRLLEQAEYGVLSTVAKDGSPYGVPLNFCVIDDCLYFHCALEGQKIDNLEHQQSVSFCAVGKTEILPARFGTKYESVIIAGKVHEAFGQEKQLALEGLLRKYSPGFFDQGIKYIEDLREKTRVFKITIDKLTGKARTRP